MRLYYDKAFRCVFGSDNRESREALIALLNAVLGLEENPITEVEVMNPFALSMDMGEKEIIMDIHARAADGTRFDIEIQTSEYGVILDRLLYNGAKMIQNSLDRGDKYDKMDKSIVIAFIRDSILKESGGYHSSFHVMRDGDGCRECGRA